MRAPFAASPTHGRSGLHAITWQVDLQARLWALSADSSSWPHNTLRLSIRAVYTLVRALLVLELVLAMENSSSTGSMTTKGSLDYSSHCYYEKVPHIAYHHSFINKCKPRQQENTKYFIDRLAPQTHGIYTRLLLRRQKRPFLQAGLLKRQQNARHLIGHFVAPRPGIPSRIPIRVSTLSQPA